MVKGISRQVIVVHSPDQKLFDQAIFILKDEVAGQGISDEALLKEAQRAVSGPVKGKTHRGMPLLYGPAWACAGAAATGIMWLISSMF